MGGMPSVLQSRMESCALSTNGQVGHVVVGSECVYGILESTDFDRLRGDAVTAADRHDLRAAVGAATYPAVQRGNPSCPASHTEVAQTRIHDTGGVRVCAAHCCYPR